MKILIADDSRAMRTLVMHILRQLGYRGHTMIEAADGAAALAAVREHTPDVVISDWNMPNMTGIECLQALRADGNQVPFGFVTTEASAQMRTLAREAGAAFLIAKPFTPDDFQAALDPYLA